jgi:hypothetical protein
MPKFESPLGSREFRNPGMREINVPDESGQAPLPARPHQSPPVLDQAAFQEFQSRMQPPPPQMREMSPAEQDILAAKRARREGKERLTDGAKRRIEMLIGMTRSSKDLDIAGQHYRLQTLTSQELRDAITGAAEYDGTVQFIFETRKQLLARSLVIVAGVEVDQFLNSTEMEARLEFIELMDHALLQRLYNEYVALAQEAQDKYAMKTEAQVKEVLEDLKK